MTGGVCMAGGGVRGGGGRAWQILRDTVNEPGGTHPYCNVFSLLLYLAP